ncbi:condensation domain-containing protein (plasmid) [Streptomyces sp. BB1-1-1]|uniref:condensation domain-containing protein n=1 Tax=Streptomyces sp. BB1-1-1 TaxID=3074430 RepID=UPI0028778D05|nr:condensation domain-containing protein [Streptomyces sp. BB1-1-1]WND32855.1 condensation domain-containing protein [Streptomyces sp. BB1-1-1]WND40077.1 condensation domain-containing protein [Streptomyces sp. BB1-1-1]WND40911.1 condensation domain-containing protein [Streptomyces sp. BB1-1-1]
MRQEGILMYAMKLVHADRRAALQASFTQEERLAAGRDVHLQNNVLTFGCVVEGPLDTGRLRQAYLALQQRHESLRLVFPGRPGGDEAAELRAPQDAGFQVVDVGADDSTSLHRARSVIAEAAAVPFDLAKGPLVRLLCVRISPALHVVGFVIDHIIVDGESCRIMAEDLFRIYAADTEALAAISTQFLDFAHSERLHLRGPTLDRLLSYWRRKLDGVGAIPPSHLHDPHASDALQPAPSHQLLVRRATIEPSSCGRLRQAVRRQRVTLTAVFAAALKDVMRRRRLTLGMNPDQAGDVAVMGSISNRHRDDVLHSVGYFATPCVLRTDLSDAPPFTELVRRETGTLLGVLRHQELPHALMTRELDPQRYGVRHRGDPGAVPAYVNFDVSQAGTGWSFTDESLRVTMIRIPRNEVPRGGVRLLVRDGKEHVLVELRTDESRFGPRWADAFLTDYLTLLKAFTEQAP